MAQDRALNMDARIERIMNPETGAFSYYCCAQCATLLLSERLVQHHLFAAPKAKQEDLEALQEGLDSSANRDPEVKAVYISKLVPALKKVLDTTPPQFHKCPAQQNRLTSMVIFSKLTLPQQLDDVPETLFSCCMKVLKDDNQENAILACGIIWQLMRLRRHQAAHSGIAAPVEGFATTMVQLFLQVCIHRVLPHPELGISAMGVTGSID